MQNIDLICVGKLNAKYFAEGVAEYQKRLSAFASFRIIELPEEKIEEKNASDAVVKKALDKEGKAILSSVRKGAAIVAMCIEGKQISSDELAGDRYSSISGRSDRKRNYRWTGCSTWIPSADGDFVCIALYSGRLWIYGESCIYHGQNFP